MDFLRYATSTPAGDLIAMLPALRQAYRKTNRKIIIYQRLGMIGVSDWKGIHAFFDEDGREISMNEYMFTMLKPLLISQEYIQDYIIYKGQEIDYDLDVLLNEVYTNRPAGSIHRWIFDGFPDLTCDLSEKWINVNIEFCMFSMIYEQYGHSTNIISDKAVINFTERYRNRFIKYFFLKQYEDKIIFAGLEKEHKAFCDEWDLQIPLLKVDNFLDLAQSIKSCKFFLGNQSFCFGLAEAMKIPRILEKFQMMPNVIPIGGDAYDFYGQKNVELHVYNLFNR